ncbi:MAG TPA: F0F1 ATP synthase subunit delta [Blastocatellia bacterium]|nr:F0F1 ATP synthase subunit delta [Blastocatellia bacterium]
MMKTARQVSREARRLFRLCLVDGVLDETRVRRVVERILHSERRGALVLVSSFWRLVRLDRSRHTAEVESATALPADLQAGVQADLAHRYGPGLRVSFVRRPALIGGMRIRVGSDVYDGSVRAGLDALERSF